MSKIKEKIDNIINDELYCENIYNDGTLIVSAFPGTGKSHLFNNTKLNILDSDSSKFDKSKFPENYIAHIKENIGKVDVILVSSHEEVRNALVKNKIKFLLVYPNKSLKSEYVDRYKERGSNEKFIEKISDNWNNWIDELENQTSCEKIVLNSNEFITDVVSNIIKKCK